MRFLGYEDKIVRLLEALYYVERNLLLLVTSASDLLVYKILLNSVLLSPIVSSGVRPTHPGQTPPRS